MTNHTLARRYHRRIIVGRLMLWLDSPAGARWIGIPLLTMVVLTAAATIAVYTL